MQQFGVQREVISTSELLRLEPTLAPFGERIVGATFTASDESGDACVFTQGLARACAARGVEFLFSHSLEGLDVTSATVRGVRVPAIELPLGVAVSEPETPPNPKFSCSH